MKEKLKYTVIKNLEQYNHYCDIHEKLMIQDEVIFSEEIELLELLIESYDAQIMESKQAGLNPVELLRTLLRDANLSQTKLATDLLLSKQLVSDVLAYKRNISRDVAIKLARYFCMRQTAFNRPYILPKAKDVLGGSHM